MHLPNETSVTTLNAVTVNVWLWLEIILNKPRRLACPEIDRNGSVPANEAENCVVGGFSVRRRGEDKVVDSAVDGAYLTDMP